MVPRSAVNFSLLRLRSTVVFSLLRCQSRWRSGHPGRQPADRLFLRLRAHRVPPAFCPRLALPLGCLWSPERIQTGSRRDLYGIWLANGGELIVYTSEDLPYICGSPIATAMPLDHSLSVLLNRARSAKRDKPTYVRLSQGAISDIEIIRLKFGDLKPSQADVIAMALDVLVTHVAAMDNGRASVTEFESVMSIPQL